MKDQAEYKLSMIMKHAPTGLAEISKDGRIIQLNVKGEAQLRPIFIATDTSSENLFPVLKHIAPVIAMRIDSAPDDAGHILTNELHSFQLSFGEEKVERHFNFTVIKVHTDCIFVAFEDVTRQHQETNAIQQLSTDRAVMQGKFEIASNILHDIGNAVVGFGSYISRFRKSMELNKPENLGKLAGYLETQRPVLAPALGEAKAEAVLKMINSITESQQNSYDEMKKSLAEQHNIIQHIQDILHIQRQYVNGNEGLEKKPMRINSLIEDCMSMLFASTDKRGIKVSVSLQDKLPLIEGDRTRVMQVILNIIKNSIEAIDIAAAEKTIAISVVNSGDGVTLQVKDNGHGFDEATSKNLFQRGFTTKASGTGLGLDHCRAIIESHGGTIELTSEGFGKGSLASIHFNQKTSK